MRTTGVRLHLARLSSAAGVHWCCSARANGLPVTCDIAIHHLHLSEMDIGYFDSHARFDPPLRAQRDREALRAAAADGLAAICSDHTPVDEDGKQLPFGEAEAGATGLELLLPLTLKWAEAEKLPLTKALARITCDPAAILGSHGGGRKRNPRVCRDQRHHRRWRQRMAQDGEIGPEEHCHESHGSEGLERHQGQQPVSSLAIPRQGGRTIHQESGFIRKRHKSAMVTKRAEDTVRWPQKRQ